MMTNKKNIGLYIHIPFCLRKCNYCDFCSFDNMPDSDKDAYISALCKELARETDALKDYSVDSIFFGGGTPSLLTQRQLENIFSVIGKHYNCNSDAEITLEVNPATVDYEKLKDMHTIGINRLSIGMQSANDDELRLLGRLHSSSDFYRCFEYARHSGFDNISVDLMYGIPNQNARSFERTLTAVTELDCEHISAYALKIEEGTPFYMNRDSLTLPGEDEEYGMYLYCAKRLSELGYTHYEISNYAKKGRESRHNLRYWKNGEYVGFGVSAYSYIKGRRYGNDSDIRSYIINDGICEKVDIELIDKKEMEYEYIMLALRLKSGIDDRDFCKHFGVPFSQKYSDKIKKFIGSEYFVSENGRYFLTDKGMYVSNSIICEFLEN